MLRDESLDDLASADGAVPQDRLDFEARTLQTGSENPGEVVVAVTGEVDMATAGRLEQVIEEACGLSARRLVVDMAGTTFMDSTGLAVLIRAHQRLHERPGAVVVRAASPAVRQVLDLSSLQETLTVLADRA